MLQILKHNNNKQKKSSFYKGKFFVGLTPDQIFQGLMFDKKQNRIVQTNCESFKH
jgi:hypothetical protein